MSEDWTEEDIAAATSQGFSEEEAKELFEMAGRWGREGAKPEQCAAELKSWLRARERDA